MNFHVSVKPNQFLQKSKKSEVKMVKKQCENEKKRHENFAWSNCFAVFLLSEKKFKFTKWKNTKCFKIDLMTRIWNEKLNLEYKRFDIKYFSAPKIVFRFLSKNQRIKDKLFFSVVFVLKPEFLCYQRNWRDAFSLL